MVCDESYSAVTEVSVESIFLPYSQGERVFELSDTSYLSGVYLLVRSNVVDKTIQVSINGVVYDIPPATGYGGLVEYSIKGIDLQPASRYAISVVTQLSRLDRVEIVLTLDFNTLVNVCIDCYSAMCEYSRLVTFNIEKYEIPQPTVTPTPVQQLPLPPEKVALSIMVSGGGTTDPRHGVYQYDKGSTVTIKAIPYAGYVFNYFLINGMATTSNPITITLDKDTVVNVSFTKTPVSPPEGLPQLPSPSQPPPQPPPQPPSQPPPQPQPTPGAIQGAIQVQHTVTAGDLVKLGLLGYLVYELTKKK